MKKLFLLLFLSLGITFAQDDTPIEQLLRSSTRPTVEDYIRAFNGNLPSVNPITPEDIPGYSSKMTMAEQNYIEMARMVVYLAKMSPNYMFFPMGRDSFGMADLLEAFWLSRGVTGKVSRVNGSTSTFKHSDYDYQNYKNGKEDVLADYMEQIGWQSKNLKPGLSPMAILFDNIVNGSSSQAAILSRAMVSRLVKNNPKLTEATINMVIGTMNTNRSSVYDIDIESTDFNERYKQISSIIDQGFISRFVKVSKVYNYMYDDSISWHGTFGALDTTGKTIKPSPGARYDESSRKFTLWHFYELLKFVKSTNFANTIKAYASELNVPLKKVYQNSQADFKSFNEFKKYAKEKLEDISRNSSKEKITKMLDELTFYATLYGDDQKNISEVQRVIFDALVSYINDGRLSFKESMQHFSYLTNDNSSTYSDLLKLFEKNVNLFTENLSLENGLDPLVEKLFSDINIDPLEIILKNRTTAITPIEIEAIEEKFGNSKSMKVFDAEAERMLSILVDNISRQFSNIFKIQDIEIFKIFSGGNYFVNDIYVQAANSFSHNSKRQIHVLNTAPTTTNSAESHYLAHYTYNSVMIDLTHFSDSKNLSQKNVEAARNNFGQLIADHVRSTRGKFDSNNLKDIIIHPDPSVGDKVYESKEGLITYELASSKEFLEVIDFVYKESSKNISHSIVVHLLKKKVNDFFQKQSIPLKSNNLFIFKAASFKELYRAKVKSVLKSLPKSDEKDENGEMKSNKNASKFYPIIDYFTMYENQDELLIQFLEKMLEVKEDGYLGARDMRRLTAYILKSVNDVDRFAEYIETLLRISPYFQKVWSRHDFFEDVGRTKSDFATEVYSKISSKIPYVSSKALFCGQLVLRKIAL